MTPPTAPTGLTANAGIGTVGLAWQAATDDTGVVAYNVHRGTSAGFAPTLANRVGRTAATAFDDVVTAGMYHYVVTAEDGSGRVSPPSNEVSAAPAADVTAPAVSITSPAPNATVSMTVTVTASASDDVGVAGVQFRVDGAAMGSEDTSPPFSAAWVTTSTANGDHLVTALARDAAGNATESLPVNVTVSNTAVPAGLLAGTDSMKEAASRLRINQATATTVSSREPRGCRQGGLAPPCSSTERRVSYPSAIRRRSI